MAAMASATRSGLDIVDAHHHLINLERLDYPWITTREPKLEALLANYYDIARDYSLGDFRAQVATEPVNGSVACEFGAADGVAEASWVQECLDRSGGPDAFIAAAPLDSPRIADMLVQYRDLPVVRALRQPLYWAADPLRCLGGRADYLTDATWLRAFEGVAESGLVWDLLVYDEQLSSAHELIGSFPETTFVLEAAGWPVDLSDAGFALWAERLEAVSSFPNVAVKFQGLALIFGTTRELIEPWVFTAVRIFGPSRCMFATHWPVDHLLWDIDELVSTLRAILGDVTFEQQGDFFGETARRIYGLAKPVAVEAREDQLR